MFGSGGPAGRISVSTSGFFGDRIEFHGNLLLWVWFRPLDSTDCKDSKGYKGFIEIPTAERRISWKGAGAPRKEEFKDAGFVLEQDGCAPEIFGSQHRSMGSRPTLSLTGFGTSRDSAPWFA